MDPPTSSQEHEETVTSAIGSVQLFQFASSLGRTLTIDTRNTLRSDDYFFKPFKHTLAIIAEGHKTALAWAASDLDRSPVVDWLLDNYYAIQERVEEIRSDLPRGFFDELPKVPTGRVRIQVLATELLLNSDCSLDEQLIIGFANAFQESTSLTIGETWAYSTTLKIALLERLAEICSSLIADFQGYEQANKVFATLQQDPYAAMMELRQIHHRFTLLKIEELARDVGSNSFRVTFDDHLASMGWTLEELRNSERHRIAAQQVSIGNVITSVQFLASIDWSSVFEAINKTELCLQQDSVYQKMDFASRNRYRSEVEKLAKGSGLHEVQVAEMAIDLCHPRPQDTELKHVGYWLIDDGRKEFERMLQYHPRFRHRTVLFLKRHATAIYFSLLLGLLLAMVVATFVAATFIGASAWMAALFTALAIVPISELAVQAVHYCVTKILPVHLRPRLDYSKAIPDNHPTFVVMPTMLSSQNEVQRLLEKIENHFLANGKPNIFFALLTDFTDATSETTPEDDALVDSARQGIRALNEKYEHAHQPFYLFHRSRAWNASQNRWMGWERKRGKLQEFGWLLLGEQSTSFVVQEGDMKAIEVFRDPQKTPYIITLDSDTRLPRDTATKLIGTAAHPLNQPKLSEDGTTVVSGYTIFQPRVEIHLAEQARSRYLKANSGRAGLDPYPTASSDVYQDWFGEGSFTGKGIYDLRAFEHAMRRRFPDNRILSHDLIEGCFARVALVSDVEVFDGYPSRYDADLKRYHRWTRGDWQIAAWLFPRCPSVQGSVPNSLSVLSRWKIFDNLRRSLVPPALVALLIFSWIFNLAPVGVSLALIVLAMPLLLQVLNGLLSWQSAYSFVSNSKLFFGQISRMLELTLYQIAFLPHKAVLYVDAIGRTLYRLFVSHKNLLEWETAAAVDEKVSNKKWTILKQLSICSILAVVMLPFALSRGASASLPLLALWFFAPLIGHFVSQPKTRTVAKVPESDRDLLLTYFSGTWAYFEELVQAKGNWLPPDNLQEFPKEKVAYRISPTNEGMFLVSAAAAHRLGFISLSSMVELLEKNLENWLKLPMESGHHYNWYDTQTMTALFPRYVSTVDSGNLMASYLTLANALTDLVERPLFGQNHLQAALASTHWLKSRVVILGASPELAEHPKAQQVIKELLNCLHDWLDVRKSWPDAQTPYSKSISDLAALCKELRMYSASIQAGSPSDPLDLIKRSLNIVGNRLDGLVQEFKQFGSFNLEAVDETIKEPASGVAKNLYPSLKSLANSFDAGSMPTAGEKVENLKVARTAQALLDRIDELRVSCEEAAMAMDFEFLFNSNRELFSIGYNLETAKLDKACYDLLSSECRLASYLAISKGDVNSEHWFRLGRQSTHLCGGVTLLSWAGTMFEYLMPNLFLRVIESSLLDQSALTAIRRQIEYGKDKGTPWGISESAYSAIASNTDYQYKSFGVPGLGLKRGLAKDLVISPYSTMLALPFASEQAIANLRSLEPFAFGNWGFYDAIDFTKSRLRKGEKYRTVQNYMAHHQGMSLLAMANTLEENIVQKWFHATAIVRANELLLEEKTPEMQPLIQRSVDEAEDAHIIRRELTVLNRQIRGYALANPKTHFLSNGQLHSMVTHSGGSSIHFRDIQVTRWRPDTTCDQWGQFIYLKDLETEKVWSATFQPTRVIPDAYDAIYAIDKVEIRRSQGAIDTVLEVAVSPEHNAEVRQLRIINNSETTVTIEVTTYSEVVLATSKGDQAHPAFQKLFVETEYVREDASIIARRRPRESSQAPTYAVHTIAVPPEISDTVSFDSSRETFLGRGRDSFNPVAMEKSELEGHEGAVLDPVFSLRCRVTIEPRSSITLGFATAIATSKEDALFLADFYHDLRGIQRAMELAWAYAQIEGRDSEHHPKQIHQFQQLGGYLIYPLSTPASSKAQSANRLPQSALWKFGISGDVPILLLEIETTDHAEQVREAIRALRFLSEKGLSIELVIINDFPGTYFDEVHEQIQSQIESSPYSSKKVFLLKGAQLSGPDRRLLESVAAVRLRAKNGGLEHHLKLWDALTLETAAANWNVEQDTTFRIPKPGASSSKQLSRPPAHKPDNGFGEFTPNGYRIETDASNPTPMPWSNVLANPVFGCVLTNGGGGYSWFQNSRENKLTSWSNDPVADTPSEVLYLRNRNTGELWSPLNALCKDHRASVSHEYGCSIFESEQSEIQSNVKIVVDSELPLKYIVLDLTNHSEQSCELQLTYFAETVLGVNREVTMAHQVSSYDSDLNCLVMKNGFSEDFSEQEAFLKVLGAERTLWTADRSWFLGRLGSIQNPNGLHAPWKQSSGSSLDPCMAISGLITIKPREKKTVVFILGAALDSEQRKSWLTSVSNPDDIDKRILATRDFWQRTMETITVQTPCATMDRLVNGWLLYQTLACRVFGRSAFYQSGGAYGFRDQLQDVMALLYSHPQLARDQLVRAAARQYIEGDVQHWWHLPSGKGTRTKFSDDFLFLPFVLCQYLSVTKDYSILDEQIPFLTSPPLQAHEHERYEVPSLASESASLLEHCMRCIHHGMKYGPHGLPLMGCGDWNDGMSRVGIEGRGESVWVGWFQIVVFEQFLAVLKEHNTQTELQGKLSQTIRDLRSNLEQHAWDGEWYRRAFFDDGEALGSSSSEECKIDSLAQSWAVLANGPTTRSKQAFDAAVQNLFLRSDRMVLLFTPPFDEWEVDPGYIKGYLPGIRENGGQYTHGALWMVQAATALGDGQLALDLFESINPANHTSDANGVAKYRGEPYVLAADVYFNKQHVGRAGWTWYTGSSAWMYRIAIENILGLTLEGNKISFRPCVPSDWTQFAVEYRFGNSRWKFQITVDPNHSLNDTQTIELVDDGQIHEIEYRVAPATTHYVPTDEESYVYQSSNAPSVK